MRDPKTKEEFLDRLLRYDFQGDIRQIGQEQAQLTRTGPNELELVFPASGRRFKVTVHRPREEHGDMVPSARSFASTEAPPAPPAPASDSEAPTPQRGKRRQPDVERWEA